MANAFPIRILIAGGTPVDREEVRGQLREQAFSVLEANDVAATEALAADAVVLIDHEQVLKPSEGNAPVIRITKAAAVTEDVRNSSSPVIPMSKLPRLPHVLREVVEDRRSAEQDAAAKAMRESQRLISIGRLTAEIAHEINNPLEAVGNLIYLALHEPGMPGRAMDYLRAAERELERVVQISKQTLSFSRESAQAVQVHLPALMDEVVSMYSRRITAKRLSLTREYATNERVVAFPGEMRQVFSNLVTNAVEACAPGGSLRLRIRDAHQIVGEYLQPGIRITVADSGAGIPPSVRKRLGEMFFSTKGESGTGLGLWVTNSIVTRSGGTMKMRSSTNLNKGTTFSIFLSSAEEPLRVLDDNKVNGGNVTEISRHPKHATHTSSASTSESVSGTLKRG